MYKTVDFKSTGNLLVYYWYKYHKAMAFTGQTENMLDKSTNR